MPNRIRLKCVGGLLAAALTAGAGVALAPAALHAQVTNAGTVTGQITDAQGKAVTGAAIVLTNTATNGAQATIANSTGRYVFTNVQPGTYTLDVKKDGFKEGVVKNQLVQVGKQLTLDVPLQVGAATQTVEVTATGAELQTMNSTVGTSISGDAIVKLPNLGRDANALTMLEPNTQPDGGIAGANRDQNSYTLDGGSNSDDMDGSHASYTPSSGSIGSGAGGNPSGVIPTPADAIEQFSVGTINQTANVNGAAGSSVAMVTKRGTDAIHGSAYDYYLGSYLAANSWSNNARATAVNGVIAPDPIPRPKSHQNRFGASLGGEILPNFLGGKTYMFGLFEGRRYPLQATITKLVPSDTLRQGIVYALNKNTGQEEAYNLNSTTVGGIAPAVCNQPNGGTGACDPRGLGLNPVVSALWTKYMPEPNNFASGDGFNTLGYTTTVNTPITSNYFVDRIDHDFGAKNHLMVAYHFYSYNPVTTNQVDIGGALPGDVKGQAVATTQRPELPSMWAAGLTSSLTANFTNDLHYSYLRNFWQWGGTTTSPQQIPGFAGLNAALEIGGESTNALIPYNVNTQSVRTRFWDGIGNTFRDDMTLLKGNHILQFGGQYTHQWDYHQRNDNGGGIMAANVDQIGAGQGVSNSYIPADFAGSTGTYKTFYNEVLGIVSQPQTLYTRQGPTLALQPLGTPMFDQSNIPMYNAYFSDSWHVRPDLTLTYGGSYTVELPPVEQNGKQVMLVDAAGQPVNTADYLANTERFAMGGQAYNPTLGFATVANVGGGRKYPYNPFYGGFSPRASLAWNPNISGGILGSLLGGNKSVIRGGWARVYGRLNGVDQVLVPLLGTGLGQAIACVGANNGSANSAGVAPTSACNGPSGADPMNAFRIGTDGINAPLPAASATLPQPYYPGVTQNGVANPAAGSGEALDPNFKPNRSDEFDLTWQRQINSTFSFEVGYTGRIIRNEYQAVNLDSVPYMLTAGGQQFQKAFANVWLANHAGQTASAQPFFETALGGVQATGYCAGFASCTAAVQAKEVKAGNISNTGNDVYSLWSDLNASSSWTLGRTFPSASPSQMQAIFENLSNGYGNYNSFFGSVNMRAWHNLTAVSNFTWGRAFGTGQTTQATSSYTVVDPFNMHAMYGPQFNDTPLNYNLFFVYEPGAKTQNGLWGHLAHGWSFAPILTFSKGIDAVDITNQGGNTDCASFGETDCTAGSTNESAVKIAGFAGNNFGSVPHSSGGIGTKGDVIISPTTGKLTQDGNQLNQFGANAASVYSQFRPMVLGLDTTGTSGIIPGLGVWNVNFAINKDVAMFEHYAIELSAQASNVFNHFSPSSGGSFNYNGAGATTDIGNQATFGVINGNALAPRAVEVGVRVHW